MDPAESSGSRPTRKFSVWVVDQDLNCYQEFVRDETEIQVRLFKNVHLMLPPLDIDTRIYSKTIDQNEHIHMGYTTYNASATPLCLDNERLNLPATRILLDKFLFETQELWPNPQLLQDCVYGYVVIFKVDSEFNLKDLACAELRELWCQFFLADPPYLKFATDLLSTIDTCVSDLNSDVYNYEVIVTRYLREHVNLLYTQRRRVEQIYCGAYLYLLYLRDWQRFNNPSHLDFYLLSS